MTQKAQKYLLMKILMMKTTTEINKSVHRAQPTLLNWALRVCVVKGEKMMYSEKMVASIKANGKILREFKDTVYCPFNTEYSILLKNLNAIRALVNIYIDGEDVVPGGLVLNAQQELELERFIKNNNLNEGNKFKFIQRNDAIEKHRGIKLEDGIIRVEYQYEFVQQVVYNTPLTHNWYPTTDVYWKYTPHTGTSPHNVAYSTMNIAASATHCQTYDSHVLNDAGITVPGSISTQKFMTVSAFPLLPEKHSIVLKLLGETEQKVEVKTPITVKHKPKCVTCGKLNKHSNKFCSECGTSLCIVS